MKEFSKDGVRLPYHQKFLGKLQCDKHMTLKLNCRTLLFEIAAWYYADTDDLERALKEKWSKDLKSEWITVQTYILYPHVGCAGADGWSGNG